MVGDGTVVLFGFVCTALCDENFDPEVQITRAIDSEWILNEQLQAAS